jgi:hypothetical protein
MRARYNDGNHLAGSPKAPADASVPFDKRLECARSCRNSCTPGCLPCHCDGQCNRSGGGAKDLLLGQVSRQCLGGTRCRNASLETTRDCHPQMTHCVRCRADASGLLEQVSGHVQAKAFPDRRDAVSDPAMESMHRRCATSYLRKGATR